MGLVPRLASPAPGPISFPAADGVTIYANAYLAPNPGAPVILAFHQAGSSKNEYAPLAPQLVKLGFNVIAVDQRSGGDMYPPTNETVQHLGKSTNYLAVLPDMDAALAYAKRTYPSSPVIAWGSSYSASLVFAFAARHPHDVAAVLAFSPGEYFDDKRYVEHAARNVRVPVFIDTASDPAEVSAGHSRVVDAARRSRSGRCRRELASRHGVSFAALAERSLNPVRARGSAGPAVNATRAEPSRERAVTTCVPGRSGIE
jgi:dienelactone hydrolase